MGTRVFRNWTFINESRTIKWWGQCPKTDELINPGVLYLSELTLEFCTCHNCVILPTQDECKCCKDFQHFVDQYIGDDCICITLHQDFETVCLNRTVLETTYICFLRYKRFTWRALETLNPRQEQYNFMTTQKQSLCNYYFISST